MAVKIEVRGAGYERILTFVADNEVLAIPVGILRTQIGNRVERQAYIAPRGERIVLGEFKPKFLSASRRQRKLAAEVSAHETTEED